MKVLSRSAISIIEHDKRSKPTVIQVCQRLNRRIDYVAKNPKENFQGLTSFRIADVEMIVHAATKADDVIQSLSEEIAELRAQLKVIEPTAPSDMRQEPRKATPQKVVVSDETLAVMATINGQGKPSPYETPVWLTVRQYAEAYKVTVNQVNGYRRRKHNALPSRKLPGVPWQVMDVPY
jgi:hypothetical protein